MSKKAGYKSFSPKVILKRITINIPVETAEWLYSKAEEEKKSLSLIVSEILEKAKEEEKQG